MLALVECMALWGKFFLNHKASFETVQSAVCWHVVQVKVIDDSDIQYISFIIEYDWRRLIVLVMIISLACRVPMMWGAAVYNVQLYLCKFVFLERHSGTLPLIRFR